MRAVSFLGAALIVTGAVSAAGDGVAGLGAEGGTPGFAPIGGTEGAEGARGGTMGRVAAGSGADGALPGSGVAAPMAVVSFLGATPGALMRTVSRFTIGVSSGLGGSVMRTVSFFGVEGSPAGLVAEGSSSAIGFAKCGVFSISSGTCAVKHLPNICAFIFARRQSQVDLPAIFLIRSDR